MTYETVIGLEVHLQLSTKTKAFCGCPTTFGSRPNSQTCPVCLGLPGALPKLNHEAFRRAVKVALALGCEVQKEIKFDRKNYYYPDLPKNFQISQYDRPIAFDGQVNICVDGIEKKIRIKRVHLEEDAGKLVHDDSKPFSYVDYNRSGQPLLEIVTEPDINSPSEAYEYLSRLKAILEYLDISDCDMEKGSLRCDANISVRPKGASLLGSKVELKNMNSFKFVKAALDYEAKRQVQAVESKERIVQETRLWDTTKGITIPMRSKEEAHDYRYFPDPDLVPFKERVLTEELRHEMPELPNERRKRLVKEFGLSDYDANILTSDKEMANFFEEAVKLYNKAKVVANWLMGDMLAYLNEKGIRMKDMKLPPKALVEILKMIDSAVINGKIAKEIFLEAVSTGDDPKDIVSKKGLVQISDTAQLEAVVKAVIAGNEKSVNDYRSGKKTAITFLIGQVMKDTKGRANPALVNEILKKTLEG